jgi:hypothetical protein
MNEELRELYEADQADRRAETPPTDLMGHDQARRRRAADMLDAGAARTGEDFFHAAMVFQHGDLLEDYSRAHELALRAAELGHRPGRWLAAAAYDRWLVRQGRHQKYGTQYTARADAWELYQVDPATTDAERAEWDVPPLEAARQRAVEMTERTPPRAAGTPIGFQALITHRAGDLEVQVCRMTSGAPPWPPSREPLQPGDPVPWLPAGLSAMRVGPGFGATDRSGELAVVWHRAGMQVIVGWQEQDGPALEPQTIEAAGHTAILWQGMHGWWLVAVGGPGNLSWMVSSKGPREKLLRIAASLL